MAVKKRVVSRFKYFTLKYFNSNIEYTYKTKLKLFSGDFVIVPTPRGNTVGRVETFGIKKPDFIFLCKSAVGKVELDV